MKEQNNSSNGRDKSIELNKYACMHDHWLHSFCIEIEAIVGWKFTKKRHTDLKVSVYAGIISVHILTMKIFPHI